MKTEHKDAVCILTVYHFADIAYEKKARVAFKLLKEDRILPEYLRTKSLDSGELANWVDSTYAALLEEHTQEHWPEEWQWTHDYYGAKCLAHKPGWDAPREGTLYTGCTCGRPKFFDCWKAVEEYTAEALQEHLSATS